MENSTAPALKSALENYSGETYAVLSLQELRNIVARAEADSVRVHGRVLASATATVYFTPVVDSSGDLQLGDARMLLRCAFASAYCDLSR